MTNLEIVPATQELVERFFGKPPIRTVRAVVAVKDNEPIAIGGLYLDRGRYVMFSEWKPEILKHRREIVMTMREVRKLMASVRIPVHAVASDDSNDGVILRHMGFKEQEGVFVWHS